ncbi:hypothetical protein SAMN02799636_04275 [Methylobacterium sp. 275MFSha3.1]|uniref:hypothetical protein n=1 Tax=Methylobacterium sp. 275MFSha3.1 TaxID=1502746 RepID=UPI0008A746F6|nr:hypothetical protein [Methylobacterium sp. 275MFSha3.1]SEH88478.1 hypothetical protein SAMN02799636_04275 [Methylobacterium sp. 275MFSha3.1]
MQATVDMTVGREALKQILAEFPEDSSHWNEAQNRFQFVDRLLEDCLGWQHPYMEVERRNEAGGKADYVLGKPPRAILEAKKDAIRFDIPPSGKTKTVRSIRDLVNTCSNFSSAVTQVLQYCALHGAQIAIVCNGPQLAIFQYYIPGMSPLDGECYLFNGYKSYVDDFPLLWKLLSPEGVQENRALRQLALHRTPRIPPKAVTNIGEPQAYRYRSPFQENLRTLSSVLLEHIEDNPAVKSAFYRDCYVPLEANNRHLLLSKKIISSRYRRNSESGSAPASLQTHVSGGKILVEDGDATLIAGSRPVVVIGDVGVGKTSFFENLFEQLDQTDKAKTYYIHLNLGVEATLSASVGEFVVSAIPDALRRRYNVDINSAALIEAIYSDDLKSFEGGIHGRLKTIDPIAYEKSRIEYLTERTSRSDEHMKRALVYLSASMGKQIILVIDNADQREFKVQQDAFLIAQELASLRRFLVFIALRPSTFFESKLTGALSGYQNRILTISPPPADEVLRKRIAFAVRVAEGEAAPHALEGIQLNIKSIVYFLQATLRSVRSNAQIRTFLSNITGGNTRLVIELISGFCGSPNVECERIVTIEREKGDYQVPLHEFTKHALLGEYSYYNPLSSLVGCNIFDISTADPREHFICCLLIAYISSPLGVKDNDGFVGGAAIQKELTRLGFNDDQIAHALRRLAKKRLIETPHAHYRELPVAEDVDPLQYYFRATSIGLYHIRFWAGSFSFMDAVSIDTPIFDTSPRGVIFTNASSFEIADRLRKSEEFRDYLETKWHESNFDVTYYDFPAVVRDRASEFRTVENFVQNGPRRNRGRQTAQGWRR